MAKLTTKKETMPANKNALIRYKTIDNCLRNKYRRWTLEDLVEACSDALYDMEGIRKGVSVRTVQGDIQMMRSDKLGYNAPIEVYEHKYYRYADAGFSIMQMPMSENDYEVMQEAVDMLRELEDFEQFREMSDVVGRLRDKLSISRGNNRPVIHFDSVPNLVGLRLLNPLYNYISSRRAIRVVYQSFSARRPMEFVMFPYLLKEFRNRWFLFGSRDRDMRLFSLALDRIVSVEASDEEYRENKDFEAEHFFDDVIGVTKDVGDKAVDVVFWSSASQSKYIRTKPLHASQRLLSESVEDRSCVFSIHVVENAEMYSVFMSYGSGVEILEPSGVREKMGEMLRLAAGRYGEGK